MKCNRHMRIVAELRDRANRARMIEKVAELVRDKRLEGGSDLRDESDRKGMRMVIEIKKDAQGDVVLNNLYKMTQLQTSFGIIMLAVVDGQPRVLTLTQFFGHFLDHRTAVIERRTKSALPRAPARAPVLDAVCSALASAYKQLAFQTLANQVRRSVRSVRGNQRMCRIGTPDNTPLRVRADLLQPARQTGLSAWIWDRTPGGTAH